MLKAKNWEASPDGIAALSILLLQDLAVAPLLVVLPLVAGTGPQDPPTLGLLAAKATFGFGAVLWACSYLLRLAFELVAEQRRVARRSGSSDPGQADDVHRMRDEGVLTLSAVDRLPQRP